MPFQDQWRFLCESRNRHEHHLQRVRSSAVALEGRELPIYDNAMMSRASL